MKKKRPLEFSQTSVLDDYRQSCGLKGRDEEFLHMFFSPYCIPVGLTDQEVRTCILLFPILKRRRDEAFDRKKTGEYYKDIQIVFQCTIEAPQEFRPSKAMTRARFRRGVLKFLDQSAAGHHADPA